MKLPKPKREKDDEFVRWLHGWKCCVPNCGVWPVDAHHVKSRGAGGSDRQAIPLCHFHHVMGGSAVHKVGILTFQKMHAIDLEAQVERFNALYNDGAEGPHFQHLPDRKYRTS